MKLAYLVLAHDRPEQLARVIAGLDPDATIVVHIDRWVRRATWLRFRELLAGDSRIHFARRRRCVWGGFGIVAGTIEAARTLLKSGAEFDYVGLISGADYPIVSTEDFHRILAARPGAQHIESFPLDVPNRMTDQGEGYNPRDRYMTFWLWLKGRRVKLFTRARPPSGFRLHGGSQWWWLTGACVRHIIRQIDHRPDVVRFFRHSFIPDEAFFQTLVSNSPYAGDVTGHDLTFAIWDRPQPPYPAIIEADDLALARASGKPFARKFRPSDFALFDRIDALRGEGA